MKRAPSASSKQKEWKRIDRLLHFEQILWTRGVRFVAGVDEVGLGALAGPAVAAAVVMPTGFDIRKMKGINDSKVLNAKQRTELDREIREAALGIGIGLVDIDVIARLNIYHAGREAMRRAVCGLTVPVEHVLIDGRTIPDTSIPQNSFIKGDSINFSIAAASIVAKVYRDRLMEELDDVYPHYGFKAHKGYGTPAHWKALRKYGVCPVHRTSYEKLKDFKKMKLPKEVVLQPTEVFA